MNRLRPERLFILLVIIMAASCSGGKHKEKSSEPDQGQPLVIASNYPLFYFADRLAGDFINLKFPGNIATDPAYWRPDAEAIADMQEADLILLNGASYEKWINKVSLPVESQLNTTAGLENKLIPLEGIITHSHGPGGEHQHSGTAMTTWLNLSYAFWQAEMVKDALVKLLPEQQQSIQSEFQDLGKELSQVDYDLKKTGFILKDKYFYFSHPVYQYLSKSYMIDGHSLHWEPDEQPSDEMLEELDQLLKDNPSGWMIWEAEPKSKTRSELQKRGIEVIVINPCGNTPSKGDFMSVMQENLRQLQSIQ